MQPLTSLFCAAFLFPILGALVAGFAGRPLGDRFAQCVTLGCMSLSALAAVMALYIFQHSQFSVVQVHLLNWIDAGQFHAGWNLRLDTLSVTIVAMVTVISTLIHLYSIGYMGHDSMPSYRFFAYISFFTFAMLMLVTANDLIQLFCGWEGVGLASYLLIGYWYNKPSAAAAAIKAFVVNRIADLFFIVGIALLFLEFGSVSYDVIFAMIPNKISDVYILFGEHRVFEVIGILLFIGAVGKSAQLFLHVWLPDAMEGPTPVSALIHAATMVTAGVFLMARMSPLIEYALHTKALILFIGATTSFFAATVGLVQTDIKRTIAYSTCSQLGYMFIAVGVGAYQISVFHLTTHAFFKALLFLAAGVVIHALHDEQDMFKMGGLWKRIPVTYACFWIGSLALAGIYPFSGYWSKDAILEAAWMSHTSMGIYGWVLGSVTAFMTALYSWRLIFLVFHGQNRGDIKLSEVSESSFIMLFPLLVLSAGAIFLGMCVNNFYIGSQQAVFWNGSIVNAANNTIMSNYEHIPQLLSLVPSILAILGFIAAYICYIYNPKLPDFFAKRFSALYCIFKNKWFFDEIYDFVFVKPYRAIAKSLWKNGEENTVEGLPIVIGKITISGARQIVKLQTGSLAVYAFSMLIGLVVLITTLLIFR
ncbi:NADH-quinone oxidoreductase subunit L [Entomobacter blattae]|uniref:NADH-quinone oxidoreductase subunit L n=1 Tax=Entomobacter blattae TaxID=2762277 RepID=A0A7H1NSY0_9PROT|nr:NADH-quinone oxidoreductase subunit L [Entomobacter blattae]QNT78890.1 NADH-quinone oxidoreductase subunit L [Entomobacter blattae]